MKAYWGSERTAPRILDLRTRCRGEWSASCPSRFTLREGAPRTYCIGVYVVPRIGLDAMMKKIPSPCRDSHLGLSSP
jgi:hypothetical protein